MRKRIVVSLLMITGIFIFMFILSKSGNGKLIKVELYTNGQQKVKLYANNASINIFEKTLNSAKKEKGKIDYQDPYFQESFYKIALYYPNKTEVLYLCVRYRLKELYFQYENDKKHIYVIPENNSRELEGLILNRP